MFFSNLAQLHGLLHQLGAKVVSDPSEFQPSKRIKCVILADADNEELDLTHIHSKIKYIQINTQKNGHPIIGQRSGHYLIIYFHLNII